MLCGNPWFLIQNHSEYKHEATDINNTFVYDLNMGINWLNGSSIKSKSKLMWKEEASTATAGKKEEKLAGNEANGSEKGNKYNKHQRYNTKINRMRLHFDLFPYFILLLRSSFLAVYALL